MNFNFKILTKPRALFLKKKLYDQTSASKSAINCRQHVSQHQHQQQWQLQQVLSWHQHTPGFTKQEWVGEWVTDKGRQWSDSGPIEIFDKKKSFFVVYFTYFAYLHILQVLHILHILHNQIPFVIYFPQKCHIISLPVFLVFVFVFVFVLCLSMCLYFAFKLDTWHHGLSWNIRLKGSLWPDTSVTAHLWIMKKLAQRGGRTDGQRRLKGPRGPKKQNELRSNIWGLTVAAFGHNTWQCACDHSK